MTADTPGNVNVQVPPQRGSEFAEARHLRRLTARARWVEVTEDTAVGIYEFLQTDWAAYSTAIGRAIRSAADRLGGEPLTSKVIESLSESLAVPECRLRQCVEVCEVVELCGDALSRRLPSCSFEVLISLSPVINTDLMPWRKREILLKIVDSVARYGFDRERIEALVNRLLSAAFTKPPSHLVLPTWHVPKTKLKKLGLAVNTGTHEAA